MIRFLVMLPFTLVLISISTPSTAQDRNQLGVPVSINGPLIVEMKDSEEDKKKSEGQRLEDRQHDSSDLAAQWLAAKSAEEMVKLTWWQIFASSAALMAALYSIAISRMTLINEHKPIIAPVSAELAQSPSFEDPTTKISVKIKNLGKGVALSQNFSSSLSGGMGVEDILKFTPILRSGLIHNYSLLAPGEEYSYSHTFTVGSDHIESIKKHGEHYNLWAEYTFLDASRRRYRAKFTFLVDGEKALVADYREVTGIRLLMHEFEEEVRFLLPLRMLSWIRRIMNP